jgi:nitrogen regulatory protein PII
MQRYIAVKRNLAGKPSGKCPRLIVLSGGITPAQLSQAVRIRVLTFVQNGEFGFASMKRVEVLMKSSALDTFKECAPRLGISEYDVADVRLSVSCANKQRRVYRGHEYTLDLVPGVKVEFVAFDEDAREVAENIFTLVAPERVVLWPLDELISIPATNLRVVPRTSSDRRAAEIVRVASREFH